MPIPKTYQTPHRTHIVKTRLSEEEYEEFRHRCDVYQVSQSEWLRQLIRTGRVHATIRATLTSDELLEAVGKLTAQYSKIGSNLNQIARFLQTQGTPYNALSEEVRTAISELADLKYQEEFLAIVRRKLSNEKFVNGAPEKVVAAERKKEADAISKIESIKASIAALA